MAWVRERTIPTDKPPLVGEVSANFYAEIYELLVKELKCLDLALYLEQRER
jgi:hypothetical protein